MGLKTLFNPPVFQGSLDKPHYFEGWYFKNVSQNHEHVISFIPGISTSGVKPHAFIQMINGRTGVTKYFEFDLKDFSASKEKFEVSIGANRFNDQGFHVDIHQDGERIFGDLAFSNITPYPVTLAAPGIMGWYAYMPFMECYHGVVSLNHFLKGTLSINGESMGFDGGKGYIEKDWGTSFPECWIWLQGNCFETPGTCVMLSVAKIPFLGRFFVGFIAFILHDGKLHRFTTYTSSQITQIDLENDFLTVTVSNKEVEMKIKAHQTGGGQLVAPVRGSMERMMKESLDSSVEVELRDSKKNLIFKGTSERTGLEITGDIINLAQKQFSS